MDEFIDRLLRDERVLDVQLPRLQKRCVLEANNQLEARQSVLDEDIDENESSDESDDGGLKSRPENTNACYWIAEKTAELTRLLKWNFFIRVGLEIYLEVCIENSTILHFIYLL